MWISDVTFLQLFRDLNLLVALEFIYILVLRIFPLCFISLRPRSLFFFVLRDLGSTLSNFWVFVLYFFWYSSNFCFYFNFHFLLFTCFLYLLMFHFFIFLLLRIFLSSRGFGGNLRIWPTDKREDNGPCIPRLFWGQNNVSTNI